MATPSKVKLPAQLTAVEDLLLWHDVPKSAAAVSGATLLYVLLEWSGIPLLTWLSNVCLVVVIGCALWAFGARFMNSTGPADHLPSILKRGLDEAAVRSLAEKTRVATNDLLALINALLTGNDWLLIAKAIAALYVIGWVGRIITPMGLLYTAVLGLFTLPKVYEMRKDEIDEYLGKAQASVQQQYSTSRAKATELINRLTPQKSARPAASDISKDE
ncbi:Reticulon-domain-containing protein [Scenedesmus sp. NREL 46B-D3]|nr:Reticulon-domain-containing protein [Scenedesmus sp. NREL 46B-D3]